MAYTPSGVELSGCAHAWVAKKRLIRAMLRRALPARSPHAWFERTSSHASSGSSGMAALTYTGSHFVVLRSTRREVLAVSGGSLTLLGSLTAGSDGGSDTAARFWAAR